MAFYFSSDTNALYDTDVFPVAGLPANKVEITEAVYSELLTKQNQGYVILADGSGNPYTVNQSEASASDMKHSSSIATTLALGHVKIGNTMQTSQDGTLDLKDSSVTTEKLTDLSVTTEKLADGAVTEEKMESVKNFAADETTLTKVEDTSSVTVGVKDGGIGTQQLADGAATTDKIANQAVTTNKIANQNVTTEKLADGAATTDKIANQAVTTNKIANQNVTTEKLADGAVTSDKISNRNVGPSKIALEGVRTENIANQNVTTEKLADGAVTRDKIANGSVGPSQIADQGVWTQNIKNKGVTHEKLHNQAIFWDPDFEDHRNGIEVSLQESTIIGYSNSYCNGKPITIVFLKNTLDFTLINTIDSGSWRYGEGVQVLIVNVESSQELFIRANGNQVIKRIPSGSSSLFVCAYRGTGTAANSIWYPIS